jgi:hypothetical protein
MTARRIAGLVLAPTLIVIGAVLYESAFVFGTHPLIFWSGINFIVAGGVWLASDWCDF